MSPPAQPRLRLILVKMLAVVLSIVVAMAISEVALRVLGHRGVAMLDMSDRIRPVDDTIVDYRYKSNSEYWGSRPTRYWLSQSRARQSP